MECQAPHRVIAADVHRVPAPFRALAVRSDEPAHAHHARAPYGSVHALPVLGVDASALAALAAEGRARLHLAAPLDITHAATTLDDLATVAPAVGDLASCIARALRSTGVLGKDLAHYRASVATRIDYLGSRGAGFHNDVARHWSRCLFWVLALDATDVEFVMPHAGVRLPVAPGDLVLFDPVMAHGLCRPADGGQAVAASFAGDDDRQTFLTGELPLSDAQWALLGSPWLPVEEHERLGSLDLMVAGFDERSGAVQRLSALRDGMKRSTCHVDPPGPCADAQALP